VISVATFVDHVVLNTIRDSMIAELSALGYTPEKGWHVIVKSANGQPDMAAAVADELLNMGPACIVSISTPSSKPVFEKNGGRLPHVYSFVSFPSSIGIREDSPNTTGLSDGVDFEGSFTLIQSLVPNLKRLGMVYSDEPNAVISKDEMLRIAKTRGVEFVGQAVSKDDEIITALQGVLAKGVDAVFVGADSAVVNKIVGVVETAHAAKVPVFATDEGSVKMGALAGLSVNYTDFGRETARVVDKVIRAKSANGLPDLSYKGRDLLVNSVTLDRLGIRLTGDLRERAKMLP
jgi:putative ABC transport system substrate-binding protein